MSEKILTKEEYAEKLNNIIKPAIEFAMTTRQFNDNGCYSKEFVQIGDKEATLVVVNSDWIILRKTIYEDIFAYRKLYYDLEKEYEKLKEKSRKKFFVIF